MTDVVVMLQMVYVLQIPAWEQISTTTITICWAKNTFISIYRSSNTIDISASRSLLRAIGCVRDEIEVENETKAEIYSFLNEDEDSVYALLNLVPNL